jgi:hypothetical protein
MEVDVDEVDGQHDWEGADSESDSVAGDSCESECFLCLPLPYWTLIFALHTSVPQPTNITSMMRT